MKNKDLYKIKNILNNWLDINKDITCIVLKNLELINILIKTFNRFKVVDKTDYNLQKINIQKKYSSNNIEDNKYIINDIESFNKEMDDLDYNLIKSTEILNNKCTLNFFKIKKDLLPNNLPESKLKEISFMIE